LFAFLRAHTVLDARLCAVGDDWRNLFDVVIVQARKPQFYTAHRHFRKIFPESGMLDTAPVTELRPGVCEFSRMLQQHIQY
jgi:hypothetical protein